MGTTDVKRCPPTGAGITDAYSSQGATGWAVNFRNIRQKSKVHIRAREAKLVH